MSLRVAFMGSPEFSVPVLSEILANGHEVVAVYTQPPRPAGRRGLELTPCPVDKFARNSGLDVRSPVNFKDRKDIEEFAALDADVAIVVAYGLLLPKEILDAPHYGCLNVHASLLPRWRGAAPIHRAVMAGDEETGVMVMKMDEGLDTGPVCLSEKVTIGSDLTTGELHDQLSTIGASLIVRALSALSRGSLEEVPQAGVGTLYARKIKKEEAHINWDAPARIVHNQIRGLCPFPGSWFEIEQGGKTVRVKVLRSTLVDEAEGNEKPGTVLDDQLTVSCGSGAIRLLRLQRAGKTALDADEFQRGAAIKKGDQLL